MWPEDTVRRDDETGQEPSEVDDALKGDLARLVFAWVWVDAGVLDGASGSGGGSGEKRSQPEGDAEHARGSPSVPGLLQS